MKTEMNLWGIHGGKTGDAATLFLTQKCIALGWADVGDLRKVKADRESFKALVQRTYPNAKPGAIPNNAGQLYRFVHEMKKGDLVVYPSKQDRMVHFGTIVGDYIFDPGTVAGYPNRRAVNWHKALPRTHFSQGALYEIGSAMSLFQVKNYADEFHSALVSRSSAPIAVVDETVSAVAEEIAENTRDFILKKLGRDLKGTPLEQFIAHLLQTMGFNTKMQPEGDHGAIDILAHKDELGIEPPIIKVQVKSGEGNIGETDISSFSANVDPGEVGIFVTLGSFGSKARTFARRKPNLRLIDGDDLVQLIYKHYEQFESRYKGVIPLKQVWVPEGIEVSSE